MKKILITGAAGFIGFHLSRTLLNSGNQITGIDNLNDYYDVELKNTRLSMLKTQENFSFNQIDLINSEAMYEIFTKYKFDVVINLAAQAGVRYSLKNPSAYINSNIVGFTNILECCRKNQIKHLIFASSSSVYGSNTKVPFSVHDNVDHPISLYAASKKANELLAHSYAHLYGLPCTGLRFFTVYGPWGRPDMAYFLFTKSIIEEKFIEIFNYGNMRRDFTYIDDIVGGISSLLDKIPCSNPEWDRKNPDPSTSFAPYRIFNIGNNSPVELSKFIEILELKIGKKAVKKFLPMQPGDVQETWADIDDFIKEVGFRPTTSLDVGLEKFVSWYKEYYGT